MDNWKDKFTPEQLEIINRYFRGEPPQSCKGECDVNGFLSVGCKKCGWHEEEPIDSLNSSDY